MSTRARQIEFLNQHLDQFKTLTGRDSIEEYFFDHGESFEREHGDGSLILYLCNEMGLLNEWAAHAGHKLITREEWTAAAALASGQESLIRSRLMTGEQADWLRSSGLTVKDLVDGTFDIRFFAGVEKIYENWNMKMGWWQFES